jgi:hypothetical protein
LLDNDGTPCLCAFFVSKKLKDAVLKHILSLFLEKNAYIREIVVSENKIALLLFSFLIMFIEFLSLDIIPSINPEDIKSGAKSGLTTEYICDVDSCLALLRTGSEKSKSPS